MKQDFTWSVASVFTLSLFLSACGDGVNIDDNTRQPTSVAQQREMSTSDEATSLWHLENQTFESEDNAAARRQLQALTQRHLTRMSRNSGDYSFDPPPPSPVSRPGQLLNLPAVTAPRFQVTDRVWPATVDQPVVSMWSQDKLAAFSLTIDDNHVQDHPFWHEVAEHYGWNWTWFIIANQVGWGQHDHWGHWQEALDKGHDIQSHTYSHLCDALFYTYREYRQSQAVINQNLDGAKVVTMAYPFGIHTNKAGSPCAPLDTERTANDRDEAAKHFLAVRDVYGALSHPGRIDYMKVPSVSAARNFFNANAHWAYFDSILDATSNNYRTWYAVHYHGLYTDANKTLVRNVLEHVKTKEADVWVGTFTEVAKYAQEYASSELTGVQATANSLRFELSDEMNDQWFDQPLTVKIRLPDGWQGSGVNATQNGQVLSSSIVSHAGRSYALVDVVPDRGVVQVQF